MAGLPLPGEPFVTASESLSLTVGRAVTVRGEGVVGEFKERSNVSDRLKFRKKA